MTPTEAFTTEEKAQSDVLIRLRCIAIIEPVKSDFFLFKVAKYFSLPRNTLKSDVVFGRNVIFLQELHQTIITRLRKKLAGPHPELQF